LKPELLVGKEISLEESIDALIAMNEFRGTGTTVVTKF
jgi:alcohol dehydrogenase